MVLPLRKNNPHQVSKPKKNFLSASFPRSSSSFAVKKTFWQRSFKEKFRLYTGEHLHGLQVSLRLAGTVIPAILPLVILCAVYGLIISTANHFGHISVFSNSDVFRNIVVSLNIVLSLLLAFRTNTAHDRFWEGRKLWGGLVNTSRNLVRGISIYIDEQNPEDRSEKEATMRLVAAFSIATKLHLRREAVNQELAQLISSIQYNQLQTSNHVPLEISLWIGNYLQNQLRRQCIDIFQVNTLHNHISKIVDTLGGCERILKTPVPLFYTLTLKSLLTIYFLLLPWQLVQGLNWWTGPVLSGISFILLGINEIGSEIEQPFGRDPNDLPLDFICDTIRQNVEDIIKISADKLHNGKDYLWQDSDPLA